MEQTQSFTQGKIFSPLIRFAVPVLFALFLQTMYGAVDLLIVGQFGGASAEVYVSAVSTGSQVMQTLTVIITGLPMGLTVFVAREIGAGLENFQWSSKFLTRFPIEPEILAHISDFLAKKLPFLLKIAIS